MSTSTLYPIISPSLNLDFTNSKVLDPRVTFARASGATYYDGVTTAKAEENLLLQSQTFNTTWFQGAVTVTADTEVAPDGTTTADTITANATTAVHFLSQAITFSATAYAVSVFIKGGTHNYVQLYIGNQSVHANFDVTSGSGVTGTSAGVTSSSIQDVGNGWYRCSIIFTASTANAVAVSIVSSSSAVRAESWAALGTETVYLWGAQLEQRSAVTAYTPTTTQAITNYVPVLQTAANNVPRFDHNPVTGESLGLLIEESRTNLFQYSSEFDNAYWSKTRLSITENTIVAPDGTLTGDKLVEDTTASNTHQIARSVSYTSGTTYTYSFFAKAGERTRVAFQFPSLAFTDPINISFDLNTGTVVAVGAGGTASISSVGNGWFRCVGTATATITTSATTAWVRLIETGVTTIYTGDGYSGLYLWGAQLEAGAFPTPYIATGAATATRSADSASMTGTNFSSWYNQGEGTLYAEIQTPRFAASGNPTLYSINTDVNNRIFAFLTIGSLNYRAQINSSGNTELVQNIVSSANITDVNKTVFAYKANNSVAYGRNTNSDDTTCTIPVVVEFSFGGSVGAQKYIRKLAYYPLRLTNAQLQALTS
jgi:hypothetical protein